jgi:hypothetical protein
MHAVPPGVCGEGRYSHHADRRGQDRERLIQLSVLSFQRMLKSHSRRQTVEIFTNIYTVVTPPLHFRNPARVLSVQV